MIMAMRLVKFISKYRLEATNFVVGAVVLTYELTATRITAPYIGTTIYVWTSIIGVILASLAIGYWAGGYMADARKKPLDVLMLLILAASCIMLTIYSKDRTLSFIGETVWPLQLQALTASLILFAPATIVLGSISPYLARLSIHTLSNSGQHLGRISAAGTVGSLFGTFLTGFWLFGVIGTRYILGVLVICLLLTTFLVTIKELVWERVGLIVIAAIALGLPPSVHLPGIVTKDTDSSYNRLLVRDVQTTTQGKLRVLQIDSRHWQSAVYGDGRPGLVFNYIQFFASSAALNPQATHFLVIGGGAFTLPAYLAKTYPQAQVDVVEIDGKLQTISADYFGFKQPKNLRIITADGRQFLNKNQQAYDMIFVDAFTSLSPPFQLATVQAVSRLASSLSADGLVVLNLDTSLNTQGLKYISSIKNTFGQSFPNIEIYKIQTDIRPENEQNILLIAGKKAVAPRVQQLASRDPAYKKTINSLGIDGSKGNVLTDDFAPVEQLVAGQL